MHYTHCTVCGKELSKRQYANWCKTCSKECREIRKKQQFRTPEMRKKLSEAQKKYHQEHPEAAERQSQRLKKHYEHQENRDLISEKTKLAMSRPEVKQHMSDANKAVWQDEQYRQKMSDIHKISSKKYWANSENILKLKQSMSTDDYKQKASTAQHNRFSKVEEIEKLSNSIKAKWQTEDYQKLMKLAVFKRHKTMKLRGTYAKSKMEDFSYEQLQKYFDKNDIIRQHSSTLYPFKCDFYIKSLDLYIECHYSHYHNYKPFDENNEEHIAELKNLEDIAKDKINSGIQHPQVLGIISTWTNLDVRKRQTALANNLNWYAFYSSTDLDAWLKQNFYQEAC